MGKEQGGDSGKERAAAHRVRARRRHLLRDAVRLRSDEGQQEGLRGPLRRIDHPHPHEISRRSQEPQHRGRAVVRRVREHACWRARGGEGVEWKEIETRF